LKSSLPRQLVVTLALLGMAPLTLAANNKSDPAQAGGQSFGYNLSAPPAIGAGPQLGLMAPTCSPVAMKPNAAMA